MTFESLFFRLESDALRWFNETTGRRPSSRPFVSGDGFRALADREYDPAQPERLDVRTLNPGDLIYCRGDRLRGFLTGPARQIAVPFSVISHNDDTNITAEWASLLPPSLVRLFAQNVLCPDPRVAPVPIGLENAAKHYNGVVKDFEKLRRGPPPDKNRILYAFTDGTNQAVRGPARQSLMAHPLADGMARVNSRTYRKIACRYRFIASPPGNGVDCHRTWEALYLRSVPIVVRSTLTEHFASLGLPLWLVDSYAELDGLTEADLDARYKTLAPGFGNPALWSDYWDSLVRNGARG